MFIVRLSEDGIFINEKANNAQRSLVNLTVEQTDNVALNTILDEKTYKEVEKRYNKCIQEKKPLSYEEEYIIDDKGPRFWNTTIIPVIDKENDIIRIFGISREITQLKRLNENLELEVNKRTHQLEEALEKIKQISITDKLTGLYNRYHIDSVLENNQKMADRHDICYGLILLDIDDFKLVNDTYGHNAGDLLLKEFSSLLKNSIRQTDILGRWGGEEFLIIVSHTSEDSLLTLAEHIREKIENYSFTDIPKITASFGVSLLKKDEEIQSVLHRADIALYKAKEKGKNMVQLEHY